MIFTTVRDGGECIARCSGACEKFIHSFVLYSRHVSLEQKFEVDACIQVLMAASSEMINPPSIFERALNACR